MIQFKSKAEMERFFSLPEGSLREMKPGERLTYERRHPLPKLNGPVAIGPIGTIKPDSTP